MKLTLDDLANIAQIVSVPLMLLIWLVTRERFTQFWRKLFKPILAVTAVLAILGIWRLGWLEWLQIRISWPIWGLLLCSVIPVVIVLALTFLYPRKTAKPQKEIIGVADLPPTRLPNVKRVAGNDLGKGVEMGGRYQNPPQDLQLVSSDWARWPDGGWVKSGWFYNPPKSDLSHAVAFFKIHCHDNGNGYVHVLSASRRRHEIWLQTNTGSSQRHTFNYSRPNDIKSNPEAADRLMAHWPFTWKKPNSQ